jgi:hypothetical protein
VPSGALKAEIERRFELALGLGSAVSAATPFCWVVAAFCCSAALQSSATPANS